MKKVCLFNFPPMEDFHGYRLETFDPLPYFSSSGRGSLRDLLVGGLDQYLKKRSITLGAHGVDRLYRERDPQYMRLINDFVDRFRDFDLIVMGSYNFIHPEVLVRELKGPRKVLGFIDDPYSTYLRGIPYLWAFDGAFYISPGYIDDLDFGTALNRWGCSRARWWPLVPFPHIEPPQVDDSFFSKRDIDVIYVGNPTGSKVDRLVHLKKHFGSRFRVHGRWRWFGYAGWSRLLAGKRVYPYRVTALSNTERTQLYWRTKIGFNMHVSEIPTETGNMRMYETAAHGMMMVCDKGSRDSHARIFAPDREALYYSSLGEAIDIIEHYLADEAARLKVAKAAFARYWNDYRWESNLLGLLDWAIALPRKDLSAKGIS